MSETLLTLTDLRVGHASRAILPPLTLAVQPGECWAIIGPNGAGKSTLLRTLLGLQPAISGTLTRAPCAIGYVPQRHDVDPTVPGRVIDFVRSGAERDWSFAQPWWPLRARERTLRAMRDTEVLELARQDWRHLSEGQKQRVLMAQALAGDPRLLVLDEPTSAMDMRAEGSLFALLDALRRNRGLGVLVISHHLAMLARYATHALFLDKDEGVARAGLLGEVAQDPAFVQRYGHLPAHQGGLDA